jgi:DnaJ-class molecular chaperone
MVGKSHFRVRGIHCGKCKRIHTWYKYRVWRDGKRIREEYLGKCDEYGNIKTKRTHSSQRAQWGEYEKRQQAYTYPRLYRSPYEILGITYTATKDEITRAYKKLALQYHPDLHKDVDPRIIVEINVAYHILCK